MPTLKEISVQIKQQADIVGIIGRVVVLKKAGRTYKGRCPFHEEKTPSFNVNPARGSFHCFGCGAGGSVIDFVMRSERLEFIDALKRLAAEMGIEVPESGPPVDRAERDRAEARTRALSAAVEFAVKWYRRQLGLNAGRVAADYLKSRGVSDDTAERFSLGAAPEGWTNLTDAARAEGFSEDILLGADLSVRSDKNNRIYDRFRNRVMFPIFDHLGRPIAMGGRRLDEEDPAKYINSSETELYKKRRHLYALNVAQKEMGAHDTAILMEGYMDVVMAHQFGFTNAVASLGTALTPEQARLVKRFASKVFFLYDGDSAGVKAMMEGGPSLLGAGLDTRVIVLPPEHDPDSYLRAEGSEALRTRIANAREYFDFALDAHGADLDVKSISGQASLVERMTPLLLSFQNDVEREAAIGRLTMRLGGLPREAVLRILAKKRSEPERRTVEPAGAAARPSNAGTLPISEFQPLERHVLKLMLTRFEALEVFRHDLEESWLVDPRLAPWILFLHAGDEDAEHLLAEAQATGETPGDPAIISRLITEDEPVGDPVHAARELVTRLKIAHHRRITAQLFEAIREAGDQADGEMPSSEMRLFHEENQITVRTKLPQRPRTVE